MWIRLAIESVRKSFDCQSKLRKNPRLPNTKTFHFLNPACAPLTGTIHGTSRASRIDLTRTHASALPFDAGSMRNCTIGPW